MRKLLVGMMLLWSIGAVVNAAEIAGEPVDVTFDITYACKRVFRGFDLYNDKGAMLYGLDLHLENGLIFGVEAVYPCGDGWQHETEYNYTIAYGSTVMEDCPWKTDYVFGWRYYDFIREPSEHLDFQEFFLELEMPELFNNGIIPHIAYYQMWNAKSGVNWADWTGGILIAGFDYAFTLDQAPELPMTFTWDIAYNHSVSRFDVAADARQPDVDDMSHMLWGLSTEIQCPMTGGTITPAIFFQNSFEKTVNPDDEFFGTIAYSFSF